MQTDIICAYQLEDNDCFVEKGEQFRVESLERDDDYMEFKVTELDTGDVYDMVFAPFDTVTLITSFLDEDSTDGEVIYVEF